jgi:hypothetical protein
MREAECFIFFDANSSNLPIQTLQDTMYFPLVRQIISESNGWKAIGMKCHIYREILANVIRDHFIFMCFNSQSPVSAYISSHTFKLGLFQGRDVLQYCKRPTLTSYTIQPGKKSLKLSVPSSDKHIHS